jgi:hypothetical protein
MYFLTAFFMPLFAVAAGTNPTIKQLVYRVSYYVLNPLIKVGFVVALVYFMWGVIEYIFDRNAGSIALKESSGIGGKGGPGADHIVYGLFGLFIMVSAFGIMQLIKSLTGSTIALPN